MKSKYVKILGVKKDIDSNFEKLPYTETKKQEVLEFNKFKKHIYKFISIFSILLILVSCGSGYNIIKAVPKNKSTNYIKSDNKVIVIDPGHGSRVNSNKELVSPWSEEKYIKASIGATGVVSKTPEYVINMQIGLKIKRILEEKGFKVIMTKGNVKENPGNIERAEIGNKVNARLVVRIHADSYDDNRIRGVTMLVPSAIMEERKEIENESLRCGKIILRALIDEVNIKSRGVKCRSNITSFNWSEVPTILVELGFLSNKIEDKLLNSDEYQNKLAKAISDGIEKSVSK